jgi:hypothetical protein
MDTLPPSSGREFEELIMVPRGGIEYMAGGTRSSHTTIKRRALVGKAKATPKPKPLGKRKNKTSPPRRSVLDNVDLVIHG